MYITCSHNHVSKPIINMGGTEYNIQEAKFIPGLSGNRLEMKQILYYYNYYNYYL